MQSREDLHEILVEKLGSRHVYFNPPETVKIQYPCIVYSLDGKSIRKANDTLYTKRNRYKLTIIDYDPDSEIPDEFDTMKYCNFDRSYRSESLYHFVYTIYY